MPRSPAWAGFSGEVDQRALESLARELAATLRPGDAVLLEGPLGSGKSTFARAVLGALGLKGRLPSPGFIVDAVYCTPDGTVVNHADLYRLQGSPEELEAFGIAGLLRSPESGEGITLVEWAERLPTHLAPACAIRVVLEFSSDETRRIAMIEDHRVAGD
ncbi:tRNA (adenosine(37)-N6)-threonylcarbamoyltransferase complex ATPase subunit type 1 TsaE [Candidatus Fermentibacterales bacterium]|nr:tRNA (adenosine(37)-N6)-threonylcarbamoyltransferase complex ATPase subunit type 1 TsaE [Candidatus Fermentibacterales bacterium]